MNGFLGVNSMKKGSLQSFVQHQDVAGNYGYSIFPVKEVHKIGILDIRILNCDRNENNILIQKNKNSVKLIPIDHGLSLPDSIEIEDYEIVWMNWPQSKEPFSFEEIEHIRKIDIQKETELLKKRVHIRKKCIRNFVAAHILLKKAALMGFSLFQIGEMVYRTKEDQPALLQKIVKKTREISKIYKREIKENMEESYDGRLERLSTTDETWENIEESKEKWSLEIKKERFQRKKIGSGRKRRLSEPDMKEIAEDFCEEIRKKSMGKEEGLDKGFFFCFEGLLDKELEKLKGKGRNRYFSSEFL